MPLEAGRSWTYTFRTGFQTFVETVTVGAPVAVGDSRGRTLSGPMGTSRLAWRGDALVASRLAGTGFDPPVPLAVQTGAKEASRAWHGRIEAFGISRSAHGALRLSRERIALAGVKVLAAKTELTLRAQGGGSGATTIEVTTWFRPGVGIVRQEQRTNRKLVVALALLDEGG